MRRYALSIQSYVLEQRKDGKPWKAIQREIQEKFGVKPPTARGMQKWLKIGLTREELDKRLMEEAKKNLPQMEAWTTSYLSDVMLPAMWRTQAIGADLELNLWMVFLGAVDATLGPDKFERFVTEYMKRRSEIKEVAAGSRLFKPVPPQSQGGVQP